MKRIKKQFGDFISRPFIKSSIIVFAGGMGANVLSYMYHLSVGRILGPAKYGEFAALLSIFYILNAPAGVLQNILVKFFSVLKARNQVGQAKHLLVVVSKYALIVLVIGFVALSPFFLRIAEFLHIQSASYLVWLYVIFVLFVIGTVNMSAIQGYQRFSEMAVVINVNSFIRLATGIIGAFFGVGWTLVANIVSNIVGYIVSFIPLGFILKSRSVKTDMSTKTAIAYSVPVLLALTATTALFSQDVVLVKHFFAAQDAGIYSSLSVLGKIIFFASSAITSVVFPVLSERKELKQPFEKIVLLSLVIVAAISFGLTAFYYLFPVFVVTVLFGKEFLAAQSFLGPFGLFIAFYSLSSLFIMIYLALGKTKVWIFALIACIAQIVLIVGNHSSLLRIIENNIMVSGGLFALLLVYYPYAKRRI